MKFVRTLRDTALKLHSPHQLAGTFSLKTPPPLPKIMRYLADHREVPHVLRDQFPVKTSVDYVTALDTDLWWLELESWNADSPLVVCDPYWSEYAHHLRGLSKNRQGAHWYAFVFAHAAGGGHKIAKALEPSLPEDWLACSEYFAPATSDELDQMKWEFEHEALTWTEQERAECVVQMSSAFQWSARLLQKLT